MIEIRIDDRAVLDLIEQWRRQARDFSPAMREVSELLMFHAEEAFDQEGPGWPALAPATQKERAKKGYTGKMLERTGQLKASIQTDYGADFARIGTNKVYAAIQQFGGYAGRSRKVEIPPRPFFPIDAGGQLNPGVEEEVLAILARHLSSPA